MKRLPRKKTTASVGRPRLPSRTPLGERLREARLAKGVTVEDVAGSLGITPISVRRHESGALEPNLARLAQYARLYSVDASILAFGEVP